MQKLLLAAAMMLLGNHVSAQQDTVQHEREDEIEEILKKFGTLSNNGESSIVDKTLISTKGKYEIGVNEIYDGDIAPEKDTGYGLYDYETGNLKKSWSELLKEGIISVSEDGELSTQYSSVKNDSSDGLDGKLIVSNDVETLGEYAFAYCKKLKEIVLPNSITKLGKYAFVNCENLITALLPNNVEILPVGIFAGCTNLANVTIPNGVKTINNSAFAECTSLDNVELPASIEKIGNQVFDQCRSIKNITIPNKITRIRSATFAGCSSLKNITIPESITIIDSNAFGGCEELTEIDIPNNVTEIGNSAFHGCTKLTEVVFPDSVTMYGSGIVDGCTSLTKLTLRGQVQSGMSLYRLLGSGGSTSNNLKTIVLGSDNTEKGMKTIYNGFSAGVTWINEFILKNSITNIQAGGFANCSGVTSMTIPESVTTIEPYAFYDWTSSQTIKVSGYSSASAASGYANGWSADATVKWKGEF